MSKFKVGDRVMSDKHPAMYGTVEAVYENSNGGFSVVLDDDGTGSWYIDNDFFEVIPSVGDGTIKVHGSTVYRFSEGHWQYASDWHNVPRADPDDALTIYIPEQDHREEQGA